MGVKELWTILAPVRQHRSLDELTGETIAVDLSVWICENQGVKQMMGTVAKPHLRNLFFRASHLTKLGINLVFVIEGDAPDLKWEVMAKRTEARFGGFPGSKSQRKKGTGNAGGRGPRKPARSNFRSYLNECCEMLDYLGLPYIQSAGEAEAMCAVLNANGVVDACITQDGDAFLYGARKVYRNFTINAKDPSVDCYNMEDVEKNLGLDQSRLIGLGLLLGCDYIPKGVPGIGKETAMKLMNCLKGINVLERFEEWTDSAAYQNIASSIERDVRKKAITVSGFPNKKIIREFMVPKDICPPHTMEWERPRLLPLMKFNLLRLEWPEEYTVAKVVPLITLWDIRDIVKHGRFIAERHLQPQSIVKTRVQKGVPCLEVQWKKTVHETGSTESDLFTTIEAEDLLKSAFPEMVEEFFERKKNSKPKKKDSKSKKTAASDLESAINELESLTLTDRHSDQVEAVPSSDGKHACLDAMKEDVRPTTLVEGRKELECHDAAGFHGELTTEGKEFTATGIIQRGDSSDDDDDDCERNDDNSDSVDSIDFYAYERDSDDETSADDSESDCLSARVLPLSDRLGLNAIESVRSKTPAGSLSMITSHQKIEDNDKISRQTQQQRHQDIYDSKSIGKDFPPQSHISGADTMETIDKDRLDNAIQCLEKKGSIKSGPREINDLLAMIRKDIMTGDPSGHSQKNGCRGVKPQCNVDVIVVKPLRRDRRLKSDSNVNSLMRNSNNRRHKSVTCLSDTASETKQVDLRLAKVKKPKNTATARQVHCRSEGCSDIQAEDKENVATYKISRDERGQCVDAESSPMSLADRLKLKLHQSTGSSLLSSLITMKYQSTEERLQCDPCLTGDD